MSEANKLSLAQYFDSRQGFRPRNVTPAVPEICQQVPDLYATGLSDGQQMAEVTYSVERKQLQDLISSADAIRPEDNAGLAPMLDILVRKIVANVIGDIAIDADFLQRQIDAAIAVLTEADQNRILRLHPDDLALLADADLPLKCSPDTNMARGTLRIECSDGWIEHGPALILDRLERALNHDGNGA